MYACIVGGVIYDLISRYVHTWEWFNLETPGARQLTYTRQNDIRSDDKPK